jgi:enamine deaminase RidA (YjgF/YER057c/UK114 family)
LLRVAGGVVAVLRNAVRRADIAIAARDRAVEAWGMKPFRLVLVVLILAPVVLTATPEDRLAELKLELPKTSAPVANYVPAVRAGNLLFLAGNIGRDAAGKVIAGKVGAELAVAQGAEAAKAAALALIATLKTELGDLRRVKRIVRVGGFVSSAPGFTQQPAVVNGASDLFVAVFGEAGKHARTSVGVAELPLNAAVEIDLIAEITD